MKKRNNSNDLSGFTRYIRGEMSKREENAFQRKLQKDPFSEEASEGLSQVSYDEALSDLDMLGRRLNKRVGGNRRIVIYRIAASVAVLMLLSSVYFIINREKPVRDQLKTSALQAPVPISEPEPVAELIQETKEAAAGTDLTVPSTVPPPEPAMQQTQFLADDEPTDEAEEVLIAEVREDAGIAGQETIITRRTEEPVTIIDADKLAGAPVAAMKKSVLPEAKGVIISSEDNLPIPGAMITLKGTTAGAVTDTEGRFRIPLTDTTAAVLVADFIGMERQEVAADVSKDLRISMTPTLTALNEVVVVGYGTAAKEDINQSTYISAQPETGKNKFNRYIEENIIKPPSLPIGQRVVVVLGFIVRSTGAIENLRVIRSPGQEFSSEAVRLIREGPAWKPAEKNQRAIDDEVRIRIVFNNIDERLPE